MDSRLQSFDILCISLRIERYVVLHDVPEILCKDTVMRMFERDHRFTIREQWNRCSRRDKRLIVSSCPFGCRSIRTGATGRTCSDCNWDSAGIANRSTCHIPDNAMCGLFRRPYSSKTNNDTCRRTCCRYSPPKAAATKQPDHHRAGDTAHSDRVRSSRARCRSERVHTYRIP